ncbi:RNA polymerase-associated protein RapA [subsurface metagenome]
MDITDKVSRLIIDNREGNTLLDMLKYLLPHAVSLDIATGFFEIGSLLGLQDSWQGLNRLRIILGDETSKQTRRELVESAQRQCNKSIELEKERDDRLKGLDAIRDALDNKKIRIKVYPKAKFHAKAYLIENVSESCNYAIVGSSSFTRPGLTKNLELNLFTKDKNQVEVVKTWFKEVWSESEELINPEILKVIDPHLKLYLPFEVYVKALYVYFLEREKTPVEWEEKESVMYKILDRYQRDGYHQALKIAETWGGALICDSVGLGKTFIGLMLLEYYLHLGKRVLLIVPKSSRESVWNRYINEYLKPHRRYVYQQTFRIYNHTDFGPEETKTVPNEALEEMKKDTDVIIIDEAHHFRNPWIGRSKKLYDLSEGKLIYFITATPINNSLYDLFHLINYFARNRWKYFESIGIRDLRSHFKEAEEKMERNIEFGDIQSKAVTVDFLRTDKLLRSILIQRSRAYVKSLETEGTKTPSFPERQPPKVVQYSLSKVYHGLYEDIKLAFGKKEPLLTLAIYNPEAYRKEKKDESVERREKQVIGLIRILLLKRLESSYKAFEASLEELLFKMFHFVKIYRHQLVETWETKYKKQWEVIKQHRAERYDIEEESEEEDEVPEAPEKLEESEYKIDKLVSLILDDMTQIIIILAKVYKYLSPETDDKLKKLITRLQTEDILKKQKIAIFTEFRDTARYLCKQLKDEYGFTNIEELDSTRKVDREKIIKQFSPYYNCSDEELQDYIGPDSKYEPIRILISTDVLSESLNLQDANIVINYDLHWNPVRLMQRIGRVDRRIDLTKPVHHDRVYFYNFLSPDELEDLLHLRRRITGKIIRINKTLGLEAPLIRPDDPVETLKLFNEKYEGRHSVEEKLRLELDKIAKERPDFYENLKFLPLRLFSGKRADLKGLFCCYRFPAIEQGKPEEVRWYFRESATGKILEGIESIYEKIQCSPDTPRATISTPEDLVEQRKDIEEYIKNTYLRALQAPQDYKPILICWMEVC